MTVIALQKRLKPTALRPFPAAELRALRAQLRAASALLDAPAKGERSDPEGRGHSRREYRRPEHRAAAGGTVRSHWCDPAENPSCAGCTRRAPDWRKGAAR